MKIVINLIGDYAKSHPNVMIDNFSDKVISIVRDLISSNNRKCVIKDAKGNPIYSVKVKGQISNQEP